MALSKFVNTFLVGADPELVLLRPPNIHNGLSGVRGVESHTQGFYGFDHGGFVIEPHPTPDVCVRRVCNNIRKSLDYLHMQYQPFQFRAGAHVTAPERDSLCLGGHVHIDLPRLKPQQITAMDVFKDSLEHLDILPAEECTDRRNAGYGRLSDVRAEHGHVEYRSMCSWLFSRKTSMLSMTGIKLAAVAPQTLPTTAFTSVKALVKWLEGFKEDDDDVRWMLDKGYFDTSMEAKPDASVTKIWESSPERGEELRKAAIEKRTAEQLARVQAGANTPPPPPPAQTPEMTRALARANLLRAAQPRIHPPF